MQKIAVIGSPGSGKSTLSLAVGQRLGLPVYHLDRIFWGPNWRSIQKDEFDAALRQIFQKDCWIIDGNYYRTMPIRLAAADTIIFIDLPTWLCLGRVLKRSLRTRERPDMGEGCRERPFSKDYIEFLNWVRNYRRKYRPRVIQLLKELGTGKTIHHLKTRFAVADFLKDCS